MIITDEVIKRVEDLGKNQHEPYSRSKVMTYEWRPGRPIAEEDSFTSVPTGQKTDHMILPIPLEMPETKANISNSTSLCEDSGAE